VWREWQTWWLSRVVQQWIILPFYVLRDNYRISEAANESESITINRLYELHVNQEVLDSNNMLGSIEEL
jgi:hypothetical protein